MQSETDVSQKAKKWNWMDRKDVNLWAGNAESTFTANNNNNET